MSRGGQGLECERERLAWGDLPVGKVLGPSGEEAGKEGWGSQGWS